MLRTLGAASDEPQKQRQIRQPSDNRGQGQTLASAPQKKSLIVVGALQNQPFRESNLRYHSSVREKNISPPSAPRVFNGVPPTKPRPTCLATVTFSIFPNGSDESQRGAIGVENVLALPASVPALWFDPGVHPPLLLWLRICRRRSIEYRDLDERRLVMTVAISLFDPRISE